MIFSSSTTHPPTRCLHQRQTLGICFFIQAWNILSWTRIPEFVNLNSQLFFLLVLGIVSRNYKTKKILLLPCMYRYIFSFTLKLITTLLQKLTIFHIWNVIQKDDGMEQNTLYCRYDEYVTTNQQT